MKGKLFIITSPSGGGKGTLIKSILPEIENLSYSVSFTTREIRVGERSGIDYFFIDQKEFEDQIIEDSFLEYALVHGNYYGTSKKQVEKEISEGNDIILEIDVQGAQLVKEKLPSAVSVFILPPSYQVLSERLIERNTESQDALTLRLNNAKKEVRRFKEFDYVVINDDLDEAIKNLKSIILAERLTTVRQIHQIQDILNSFENY